jgi:FAD:protein FMN transferase
MGGRVDVSVYDATQDEADACFDSLLGEGRRLEKVFSLYDPDSELSALNTKRSMDVSNELLEVLKAALAYSRQTGGRYDVTRGRQYLARKGGMPIPEVSCTYGDVRIRGRTVTLEHPDLLIDLGSIAKGYIGDRLIENMRELGISGGFIDARGDMKAFGEHPEVVWVQHPRDREKKMKPIVLENAAVATSGDYNQYDGSYDRCHIMGKRGIISATVVADTLMDADAAATCLMLLGAEESGRFLETHPGLRAYAIGEDLAEHTYNGYDGLLVPKEALDG